MGTHMKTTIELSDKLLGEARKLAAAQGVPVRELVERGLRHVVAEARRPPVPFVLRKASFKGKGLRPELQGASWDRLRELAYEGRGG
jgi:hypothetical protein